MNLPRKILLIALSGSLYFGSLVLIADTNTTATPPQQPTDNSQTEAGKGDDKGKVELVGYMDDNVNWDNVLKNITFLYFAATLVEAGLGVIFRWRIWVRYFDSKGIKVPIIIAYSALLLHCTRVDPVYDIFNTGLGIQGMSDNKLCTKLLSALLIAGGSAGVITLYKKLRLRDNGEAQDKKKETERSKRRFKLVKVIRKNASPDFPIQVILDKRIIGTIPADKNSFAAFAGVEVDGKEPHNLELKGHDKDGNPIEEAVISNFEIAPGAIAEFEGVL